MHCEHCEPKEKKWSEFQIAIPIALAFVLFFVFLQKLGLTGFINSKNISYSTSFVIGIVASLSSCMAVIGGLLLSMSATFSKDGDRVKPQLLFHTGRLVSFFVLGGLIGSIGSLFTLNTQTTFFLNLFIGLVMVVLGINLLEVFSWTKKLHPTLPKFISKYTIEISKLNHTIIPFLVGVATFFFPCGFTQSMQIYTLSTGNFTVGALTMFSFALGTLPALAIVSFGSSIIKGSWSGIFFKSVGLIIIIFSIFDILNSFVIIGLLKPIFNL